jgi:methionyl aminopeptidase
MIVRKKLKKNKKERQKMKVAGELAASVLEMIEEHVVSGISTYELDRICHEYITRDLKAIPAPLNYHGFPKSICTSVNDTVCHGIPREDEILKDGDIINIDITVIKDKFHGDTSKMFLVGDVSSRAKELCNVAHMAMWEGIGAIKPGLDIGVVGAAIEDYVHTNSTFHIARNFSGHGIGTEFHEFPPILPYRNHYDVMMEPGMTFTVEPIINESTPQTIEKVDSPWVVYTMDGGLSAQYEHTIMVTKKGYEILTLRGDEKNYANV